LGGRGTFGRIFDQKMKESRGPLVVYARPNCLKFSRLGISIGRTVGTAPKRNRIKRLLRESFRLMQHDLPTGYDLVVVVRRHEPMILAEYQKSMSEIIARLHRAWVGRA
jgi:ribonuclease P protein component